MERELCLFLGGDDINSFTEFVLELGYELECTRLPTSKHHEMKQPNKSNQAHCLTQYPKQGNETVTVELSSTRETMNIEFCPKQIQPLLDLCAKVRLWYE